MRADTRSGKDATTRRTQPNWTLELIKAGVPYAALPIPPAPDASHREKCKHAWALRKLWAQRTGRTIERLTPPGYAEKIKQKKREAHVARAGKCIVDRITAEELTREIRALQREAQMEADAFIAEDIRQVEPFTQIDTRAAQDEAVRLSPVSQTAKEGHQWVTDAELGPEKAAARTKAIMDRYAALGVRLASGATYVPAGE
ncbi:hypothetical protein [Rhizobium laguerreae]|uniref:Uncharacterized protein n=1 Tax=Rhizobium laguerreae TaxID=1076926 RepID=A0A7Y2W9B9_9HYPH|nr:hypothetical protein [Rhizobium laguerreae]NNH68239.1 hypothetical protein [Rhizobium laguerreae]